MLWWVAFNTESRLNGTSIYFTPQEQTCTNLRTSSHTSSNLKINRFTRQKARFLINKIISGKCSVVSWKRFTRLQSITTRWENKIKASLMSTTDKMPSSWLLTSSQCHAMTEVQQCLCERGLHLLLWRTNNPRLSCKHYKMNLLITIS